MEPTDKTLLNHGNEYPQGMFDSQNEESEDTAVQGLAAGATSIKGSIPFLQKLNPANLLKPFQEKIERVKESLLHPNSPAYGGVQYWSPDNLWEKIHQTGHHVFTGKQYEISFQHVLKIFKFFFQE